VGPVITQITLNTTAPLTTATPAAGTFLAAVDVSLSASDPNSTIRYTIDGSDPSTSATAATYSLPIPISTTTTLKYFAANPAGNVEAVKSGVYVIHTGLDLTVNSFKINNGAPTTNIPAVILTMDAVDPMGVAKMRFSNDGVNYSLDEPYATSKAWTLSVGDGAKNVFVRFTDGAGILYAPVAAQIALDTTAPVSTASPAAGTFITPINVVITSSDPSDVIKYTLDNTDPATSTTALTYTGPVNIAATATLKYFATDLAGNAEAVKSNLYTFHASDLVASVRINDGATVTNNTAVTLALFATDATGVAKMRFSSDGVNYSPDEPYATSKAWTLGTGDGVKNVFVRFTDGAGMLYDPVTAQITLDTTAPITTTTPAAGTYISSVTVALTANEANSTFRYTVDGSDPTTSATAVHYNLPINISADTTLKYYATDPAGNAEAVKTGLFVIHVADLKVNTFKINGGIATTNSNAVVLTIDATDALGVTKMRFSNDGVNYTADEAYATSKAWTLSAGDGIKNVFVRFTDGAGILYDPVTAQITVDSSLPVTTATPIPGTYASALVTVTLTASKPATIYYTTDGTTPTTASAHYAGPITLTSSSTIDYFAVDAAGNVEPVKTGTWTIHVSDMISSVLINSGAISTNSTAVTLTLNAVDPLGVDTMQFSNDGIIFTPEEPYATSKAWTLSSGDGTKTVYVRFRDKALPTGNLYEPVTASIQLSTGPKPDGRITGAATVVLADALRALQMAAGLVTPTAAELAHGDVAPMVNGKSAPDGVINILDALVILRATLGLVTL
jgi:phage baseplate assembly protein gpV